MIKRLRLTELPIGKWTDDYKKFLDSLLAEEPGQKKSKEAKKKKAKYMITDYINNSSDTRINFTISLPKGMSKAFNGPKTLTLMGLRNISSYLLPRDYL